MRTLPLVSALIAVLATSGAAQVVINEVSTGPADWVEIANLGGEAVDLSSWHLLCFEDTGLTAGAAFTFPGAPGGGSVLLQPNACLVVTDDLFLNEPQVPAGVPIYFFGFNLPWNTGEAGSVLLADAQGNGIDYFAHGNPNALLAPFEAATWFGLSGIGTTSWTPPANPAFGLNDQDVHARNDRLDGDGAADWSMRELSRATPGLLNPFQAKIDLDGQPPLALISASREQGVSPLTVRFSNVSSGDCQLSAVFWDLDASGSSGANASTFDAVWAFATPPGTPPGGSASFDVVLHLADTCGGVAASLPLTITVFEPLPLVAQGLGFYEDFDGPLGPDGAALSPAAGWDVRAVDPASRVRTVDPRTLGAAGWADASLSSGPRAALLDSALNANLATNELILHVDGDAIAAAAPGAPFRVRMRIFDHGDEVHPEDVVVFQDGVTPGYAVNRHGQTLPTPGVDGFAEIRLADWHQATLDSEWTELEWVFDAAFFAAHPQLAVPGSGNAGDYRIIVRQRDDFSFEGGDGLLIDQVRVLGAVTAGPGAAGSVTAALMDLNDAVNANGNAVGDPADPNGPFFTQATPGLPMVFSFDGEPNQPVLLLAGALNPGAWSHPTIGQLDIGGAPDPNLGLLPSGLVLLADGTVTDFVNSIFNTTPLGRQVIAFTTPALPPGFTTTLQAVIHNAATVVRISNAVQLVID